MDARERRRHERYQIPSIPVQVSEIDAELIDLSLSGAAIIHRSPLSQGANCTLVFPSYTGFYIACQILRSVVQVQEREDGHEYVFRTSLIFQEMSPGDREPLHEFLELQIARLEKVRAQAESETDSSGDDQEG